MATAERRAPNPNGELAEAQGEADHDPCRRREQPAQLAAVGERHRGEPGAGGGERAGLRRQVDVDPQRRQQVQPAQTGREAPAAGPDDAGDQRGDDHEEGVGRRLGTCAQPDRHRQDRRGRGDRDRRDAGPEGACGSTNGPPDGPDDHHGQQPQPGRARRGRRGRGRRRPARSSDATGARPWTRRRCPAGTRCPPGAPGSRPALARMCRPRSAVPRGPDPAR